MDENNSTVDSKGLDIFVVLNAITRKDVNFFRQLPEHQKKKFSPFLTYQWMFGQPMGDHVIMLNEINQYIFPLRDKPELLYHLLIVANEFAPSTRFNWVKFAKNKPKEDAVLGVIAKACGCSVREAALYRSAFADSEIIIMAHELGYQPDEIKDVTAQLKRAATD